MRRRVLWQGPGKINHEDLEGHEEVAFFDVHN
jgi:hypothetical protein